MIIMAMLLDSNVEGWFHRHSLPRSNDMDKQLSDDAIECIEEIKLLPDKKFLGLFAAKKFVVKVP